MNIDIVSFKEIDKSLYLNIKSIDTKDKNDEEKSKKFQDDIKDFLGSLTETCKGVKYIEEYTWISETVTFWERYLESAYNIVVNYDIPLPKKDLIKRSDVVHNRTDYSSEPGSKIIFSDIFRQWDLTPIVNDVISIFPSFDPMLLEFRNARINMITSYYARLRGTVVLTSDEENGMSVARGYLCEFEKSGNQWGSLREP